MSKQNFNSYFFRSTAIGAVVRDALDDGKKDLDIFEVEAVETQMASLTRCLTDLHRDKFEACRNDDDEPSAMELLNAVQELMIWARETKNTQRVEKENGRRKA